MIRHPSQMKKMLCNSMVVAEMGAMKVLCDRAEDFDPGFDEEQLAVLDSADKALVRSLQECRETYGDVFAVAAAKLSVKPGRVDDRS